MNTLLQLTVSGLLVGGIYALTGIGLSMVMGVMRIVNVAHGVFFALGAYASYVFGTQVGLPFYLAVPLAVATIFVLAATVEHLAVRHVRADELRVVILTLALAFVGQEALRLSFGGIPLNVPPILIATVSLGPAVLEAQRLIVGGTAIVAIVAFYLFLKRTRFGMGIRMVAEDPEAATLVGINPDRIFLVTFGAGAAMAALAGALVSPLNVLFPAMGWDPLLRSFAVVILGGLGSFWGTVLAGLVLGVVELYVAFFVSPTLSTIAAFLVLVVVIILRPSGFFGRAVTTY